jgi:hypothetical protein
MFSKQHLSNFSQKATQLVVQKVKDKQTEVAKFNTYQPMDIFSGLDPTILTNASDIIFINEISRILLEYIQSNTIHYVISRLKKMHSGHGHNHKKIHRLVEAIKPLLDKTVNFKGVGTAPTSDYTSGSPADEVAPESAEVVLMECLYIGFLQIITLIASMQNIVTLYGSSYMVEHIFNSDFNDYVDNLLNGFGVL